VNINNQKIRAVSDQHHFSPAEYKYLSDLIYKHSRIALGPSKHHLLSNRLARRQRELGLTNWQDYCKVLQADSNDQEIGILIDLISTNHTHFFREKLHFEYLESKLLNHVLQNTSYPTHELRCWSAGSSSGEEAFSLAMTIANYAQQEKKQFDWHIYGTDISEQMLARASAAIYQTRDLNLPDPSWLSRYFLCGHGPYEGRCKVKSEIVQHTTFTYANLFQEKYPIPKKLHIIFCRNVLIYFDLKSQQQLITRMYNMLQPGGYFFIGHSESLLNIQHRFETITSGIYRRPIEA
jgi:chemotaxis protein methyltransferase CheR